MPVLAVSQGREYPICTVVAPEDVSAGPRCTALQSPGQRAATPSPEGVLNRFAGARTGRGNCARRAARYNRNGKSCEDQEPRRGAVRRQVYEENKWPPLGGPEHILEATSTMAWPLPGSPLH
jgi:hypothetical protein